MQTRLFQILSEQIVKSQMQARYLLKYKHIS
jgi:hypothetical protein